MKKSIGWGLGRCNMNCEHCYNSSCCWSPQYSFEDLKKIADRICPNVSTINYGTGEFAMNKNAFNLARYIKETYPHISQAVTTNGATIALGKPRAISRYFTEITPSEIKEIFHDLDISLDYADPERHDSFRHHPKAWKWVIKGLEKCLAENIETSLVTCVNGQTSDKDLVELIEFAADHQCSLRINWFRPTGRGKDKEKLKLTAAMFWNKLELISKATSIEALSDPLIDAVLDKKYNLFSGCACGVQSCRIQTSLNVTPCVFLGGAQWSGGSIEKKSLDEIFESDNFKKFRSRQPKVCLKCEFYEKCRGGCTSRAVLYRGSLNQPDGFCPIVNGVPMEQIERIKTNMKILKTEGKKVHDGYLCTLIMKP
jgi:mycofactocin biosynthetic radical S-adenosylmethionine protein MftC